MQTDMNTSNLPVWPRTLLSLGTLILLSACVTPPPNTGSNTAGTNPAQSPIETASEQPGAPTIISRIVETQEQTTLRTLTVQQDQLYRVAAPLLTSNTALCTGNARNLLGFTAKNKYSFPPEYLEAAQALGYGDALQITGVLPDSGADRSGLKRQDLLISASGKNIPKGPDAERQAAILLGPIVSSNMPVRLTLERSNAKKTTTVPLTLACAFNIELGNSDNVSSYADGRRVLITRGMLAFTKSDEELAYVIAKEIAHNALGHATQQRMIATVGGVIDNLLRLQPEPVAIAGTSGIRPYPQALDIEADTVALYMLARAGYNIDNALSFWRRLGEQYPVTVHNGYNALHPAINQRLDTIRQVVDTIKIKQSNREVLMP
jgi:hypothetical protein